jgi:plastocyanin
MRFHHFFLGAVVLLAAAVAVAAVVARGSDDGSEPVATTEVTMAKSYRFDPETIEVEAGSTVNWTNEDNFTHTVQVDGQEDHEVEPGESFSITFDEPGAYGYVCTLHRQDMSGKVSVR